MKLSFPEKILIVHHIRVFEIVEKPIYFSKATLYKFLILL